MVRPAPEHAARPVARRRLHPARALTAGWAVGAHGRLTWSRSRRDHGDPDGTKRSPALASLQRSISRVAQWRADTVPAWTDGVDPDTDTPLSHRSAGR